MKPRPKPVHHVEAVSRLETADVIRKGALLGELVTMDALKAVAGSYFGKVPIGTVYTLSQDTAAFLVENNVAKVEPENPPQRQAHDEETPKDMFYPIDGVEIHPLHPYAPIPSPDRKLDKVESVKIDPE